MTVRIISSDSQERVKITCQTEHTRPTFIHGYLIDIRRRQRHQAYSAKALFLQLKLP